MAEIQVGLFEGKRLRDQGRTKAAKKHGLALELARFYAYEYAKKYGEVSIDQLDLSALNLGNAAGSLFVGPEWECIGFRQSTRAGARARVVRVWRLRD